MSPDPRSWIPAALSLYPLKISSWTVVRDDPGAVMSALYSFSEMDDSSINIIVPSPEQLGDPVSPLFPIFLSCCRIVPTIFPVRWVDYGNWGSVKVGLWFKRCCRTGVSR